MDFWELQKLLDVAVDFNLVLAISGVNAFWGDGRVQCDSNMESSMLGHLGSWIGHMLRLLGTPVPWRLESTSSVFAMPIAA